MRLITKDLFLKPLNLFELDTLINGLQKEEEVDFAIVPNRYRNQLFKDCLINDIKTNIVKHPKDYLYNTIWLIVNKESKLVAGHMFFSGCPNECGEVELYTEIFEEKFEHQYLKESLLAILAWAASVSRIKLVRANAPVNDSFISRIMKESGFEKIARYQHFENWIWKNEK